MSASAHRHTLKQTKENTTKIKNLQGSPSGMTHGQLLGTMHMKEANQTSLQAQARGLNQGGSNKSTADNDLHLPQKSRQFGILLAMAPKSASTVMK